MLPAYNLSRVALNALSKVVHDKDVLSLPFHVPCLIDQQIRRKKSERGWLNRSADQEKEREGTSTTYFHVVELDPKDLTPSTSKSLPLCFQFQRVTSHLIC